MRGRTLTEGPVLSGLLTFFIGLFVGGIVGVFTMCLFQINRK